VEMLGGTPWGSLEQKCWMQKTTEIKSLQSQVLAASVGVVAANLTLVFESVIHSEGFP
jgi:hypothetical protein